MDRELQAARDRVTASGFTYPKLPSEIDRKAILRADKTLLREWIKRYSDLQITQRLQGII